MIYDGDRTCRCNKFGMPHRLDQCTLILSRNPSDGCDHEPDEDHILCLNCGAELGL